MMKKFFNADVEDAERIAVVTGPDQEDIYEVISPASEIVDLPADFANWKRYTAHAVGGCTVEVMSREGD